MSAWRYHLREDGICFLTFDTPNSKANVLTTAIMQELAQVIASLAVSSEIAVLVIQSAKPDIFIAGADIAEIQGISSASEGVAKALGGQKVLDAIAALPFPTVALLNGATLGGGLELALACTYRVVTDNPKTKIGLPEVTLGIIPGFGGTQRLPRLIGLADSVPLILSGKSVDSAKARKLRIADFSARTAFLEEDLQTILGWVLHKPKPPVPRPSGSWMKWVFEDNSLGRSFFFKKARMETMSKTGGHYPAPLKALEVIEKTVGLPLSQGLEIEAHGFSELVDTPTCKNLVQLFFSQEALKKDSGVALPNVETKEIQKAGVLGAGFMGGAIAWLFSYHGKSVVMKDLNWDALTAGMQSAKRIYDGYVKRRKLSAREMELGLMQIQSTPAYDGFQHTDFVLEAVVENMEIKQKVLQEVETHLSDTAIIASNTSSLSITELAGALRHPERMVGMHFFSPVERMPLVEVIPGEKTDPSVVASIVRLSKELGKVPIVVKNCPGFLINRVLIPYVVEAAYLLKEGASIARIDRLLTQFGMPVGPLALADEVGFDVGFKVAKILESAYGERMKVSDNFAHFYETFHLKGRKSGKGFYTYFEQSKTPNIELEKFSFSGADGCALSDQDIVDRLILIMVNEAARCLEEGVVKSAAYLDMAMIMGTGFPPFRGGLCRYADQRGISDVVNRLDTFAATAGLRYAPAPLLKEMVRQQLLFYSSIKEETL